MGGISQHRPTDTFDLFDLLTFLYIAAPKKKST
jgi:hypothetical protein